MCGECDRAHRAGEETETHGGQELGLWPAAGQWACCGWVIPHPTAVHPLGPSRAFLLPPPQACVSSRPAAPVHLRAPARSCSRSIQTLGGAWVEAESAAGQDMNGDPGALF